MSCRSRRGVLGDFAVTANARHGERRLSATWAPSGHYQVETRLWLAMITICRFIVRDGAASARVRAWSGLGVGAAA